MTPDPAQLRAWVDEIIPNVTFPATAGPVRRMAPALRVTQRVALLGKPLRRRHSQVMHDAAFAAAGIDARYELLELDEADVPAAVAAGARPGWLGLQVTAPYKRLVAGLCDDVEADAAAIGAVNNVARTAAGGLVGFNTDAPGFRAGGRAGHGPARWPAGGVVVAGAGGAAHAVVFTCLSAGRGARDDRQSHRRPCRGAWPSASRGVGGGPWLRIALDDPAFAGRAPIGGPGRQRDDGRDARSGHDDRRRGAAGRRDGLRPGLRASRDAPAAGRARSRAARGERVRDAHRAGGHRLRALDRRRRHGRRDAGGRRAAARGRRGAGPEACASPRSSTTVARPRR